MELDQVELMNKINRLERDLIHKEKEYKIMSLRIRDASQEIPGALRHRRKSLVQISRNGTSPRRLVKSAAKYRTSQQEAAHPIPNQKEDIWEKKKQIQE
jgi:PHD/YefM family antitoxin component YafN of YafNO toxin-antitoxin module